MSQDFTSTKQIYEYLIAGGKVKYEYLSGFIFLDNNGMTNRDHASIVLNEIKSALENVKCAM